MELTVISGKGGTGKTTIAMALASLSDKCNLSDCDVDASNLYLYFKGKDIKKEYFYAGKTAKISEQFCNKCGRCKEVCQFDAIAHYTINPIMCESCGACTLVCPNKAITLKEKKAADAYISMSKERYLSRAQMEIGSDGSGKLVSHLRKSIQRFGDKDTLILIDGSPGIGCPVISSVTAADMVLIVTEPSMSGLSDFKRISELCNYFGITTMACINKYDINREISSEIEAYCTKQNIKIVGKIPYDDTVLESINKLKPITEYSQSPANKAIREMWVCINEQVNKIIKIYESEEFI